MPVNTPGELILPAVLFSCLGVQPVSGLNDRCAVENGCHLTELGMLEFDTYRCQPNARNILKPG